MVVGQVTVQPPVIQPGGRCCVSVLTSCVLELGEAQLMSKMSFS